jgi:hypothetical protein
MYILCCMLGAAKRNWLAIGCYKSINLSSMTSATSFSLITYLADEPNFFKKDLKNAIIMKVFLSIQLNHEGDKRYDHG